MIAVKEKQEAYFSAHAQIEKSAVAPAWLGRIRKDAIASFADMGFPTTHLEAWKYTNVAPIAGIPFQPARYEFTPSVAQEFNRSPLADLDCSRIAFINGRFSKELSSAFPDGVRVTSLAGAIAKGSVPLEENLARYADYKHHSFAALNTAFIQDGAFVEVSKGIVLDKPIYLLFVSVADGIPAVSHPRSLILAGRESQFSVIEGHWSLDSGNAGKTPDQRVYFTNAVAEIVADENAFVRYCKVQREDEQAFHIATLRVEQARNSNVETFVMDFGGTLAREEIYAVLNGEGAECKLNGLYVTNGRQHVDNHTTLDHAKPHCSSREVYKGVLDGQSTGVFNGKIIVRKDAQKTDSKQSNKNLMLSEDCVINTKPQLEIYADDVKCTHGATIGQIDSEAIFYLRSRGIDLPSARSILTYAFANEIVGRLGHKPLRACLQDALFRKLGGGLRGEEV